MTETFPRAARRELANAQQRANLARATSTIRAKRGRVVAELSDWEELREAGKAIKADVLANLDSYLVQFETAVTAAGGQVHWASDAAEANAIREVITDIGDLHQRRKITKAERERRTDELWAELDVINAQLKGVVGVDPLVKIAGNPNAAQLWEELPLPSKRCTGSPSVSATLRARRLLPPPASPTRSE